VVELKQTSIALQIKFVDKGPLTVLEEAVAVGPREETEEERSSFFPPVSSM